MTTPELQAEARRQGLRSLLRQAAAEPAARDPEQIVAAALVTVAKLRAQHDAPLDRVSLDQVAALAGLVGDADWQAPPSLEPRVLVALSHFADGCEGGDGAAAEQAAELCRLLAEDLGDELAGFAEFTGQRDRLQRRRHGAGLQQHLQAQRRRIRARIQGRRWRRARPS